MKPWPYPGLVAHRGGGSLAPENTLASIRVGQSLGFHMHEFDVKLSRDEIPFLLHDATLERTTTGTGPSCERTWKELSQFDAGRWHSESFRGERLASFEAAARLLQEKDTLANVEIKPSPGFEVRTGEKVAEAAAELWHDASVPPLLSSFSFEALMAAKRAAPKLPRGFLTRDIVSEDWKRLDELEAVSVHTDWRTFQMENLARAHAKGLRVLLYTVNDPEKARSYFDAGVDSLVTDNLAEFARLFPEAIRA
jgi:glycerophosphoryl diester phosphodiesterase